MHRPVVYNGCGTDLNLGFSEVDKFFDNLSSEADATFTKSVAPRVLSLRRKAEDLSEHYTPVSDTVNSWTTRPLNRLLVEGATLIAHGGSILGGFDVSPSGAVSERQMDILGEVGKYVRARQPYITNATPVYDVGLLLKNARQLDPSWVLTLLHHQVPFGIVIRDRVELSPFKLVIVDEGFPLNDDVLDRLEAFVQGGGNLIIDGRVLAEHPADRLLTLLGLHSVQGTGFETNYLGDFSTGLGENDDHRVRTDGAAWKLEPAGAEPLCSRCLHGVRYR